MRTRIRVGLAALLVALVAFAPTPSAQLLGISVPSLNAFAKLDPLLQRRVLVSGQSRILVRAASASALDSVASLLQSVGGTALRALPIINTQSATLPNAALMLVASSTLVERLSLDRVATGTLERTGATIGAGAARDVYGVDGAGIGVAVIDSGVTSTHDDLNASSRIDRFVDLVNGRLTPYDDYGHGTHVAGIIAGNGFDSDGARSGVAPGATLTAIKVLNASGQGRISDVIAALGYVVAHRDELHLRVVNLSVAAAVYESYDVDPLTLAALAAVRSGIVVVAAAGNNGRSSHGHGQYGGITAPGNAPWVLTVGASSHMGTTDRGDDTIAAFSSRGPGAINDNAKPDLVAPGVGIESLSDPLSAFYGTKSNYLLPGTAPTSYLPYLSLSGTSMAAPVVAGTVALMLQANPALAPNAVKAILQYTSQAYHGWDPLTQGAGFLNARGAVQLARYLANPSSGNYPGNGSWSKRLIWNNRLVSGGRLTADANAWPASVTWGAASTPAGYRIEWGVVEDSGGWLPWTMTGTASNVVWGARCGNDNCAGSWQASAANDDGDTVVWGTDDGDTVVWGTDEGDTVVWGTDEGDTVVWGTSCNDPSCTPVVWGRP